MAIYYSNTWNVRLFLPLSLIIGYQVFFLVSGLPDVVYLNFFCKRIDLSTSSSFWSPVPTQRNRAPGGWPPSFDGLKCVEGTGFEFRGMFLGLHNRRFIPNVRNVFQIGALFAHVILFWGPYVVESFKLAYNKQQPDPHFQVRTVVFTKSIDCG